MPPLSVLTKARLVKLCRPLMAGCAPRLLLASSAAGVMVLAAMGGRCAAAAEPTAPSAPAPRFDTDIRHILASKCIRCHGDGTHKGGLDLRSRTAALKGGESGPVVVPGKPGESPLYEQVRDGTMPADGKDPLTDAEIEVVRRWIESGLPLEAADDGAQITADDIRPLLLLRCTVCHGRGKREANLDLRSVAALLQGGKSGPAVVPGKPEESLLLKKIAAGEMPPRTRLVEVSIKPIEAAEIDKLRRWIAAGCPDAPPVASTPEAAVGDEERQFWSFQPPRAAAVPAVQNVEQVRNAVDAFLLARLEAAGLALAPEASPEVLLRRAYFDLTGLPPEPEEVEAYLADSDPRAYEKLIERLLASPAYGERWGRHWLDLAGYADSEGKTEQDLPRPHAYRYRDYVIRAFNADKPYDRFLLEQLAGDELADYEHAAEITPEIYDNLVATGFLRMAPDPTWANITGFVPDRLDVIADEIDVLSSSVMGLTFKCTRCHSHKFDPIPQRDYYRLAAIFKGALDEHDWLKPQIESRSSREPAERHLPYVSTAERRAWEAETAALESEIDALRAELEQRAALLREKLLAERLARLPEVLRDDLRRMLATPAEKRNEVQKYLAEKFEATLKLDRAALVQADADFKAAAEETDQRIVAIEGRRPAEPMIRALWDRGDPSPTYVYRRGNYLEPGARVEPGMPEALNDPHAPFVVQPPWPGASQTGRRLAFARWLTRADHPLTARVMVNRLWKHHFGSGLVRSLGNFGRMGTPPSHPELLDWLAVEFVRRGWSLKAMHRLMMTSSAYRQSSSVSDDAAARDPENRLWSRMPLARMEAEVLHDTLLAVSAALDRRPFGPPDAIRIQADGLVTISPAQRGWRRSIYASHQRKRVPTVLETFDLPQMNPNCLERSASIVAPQALHLLNDDTVRELAERFASRMEREAGNEPARQIERIYLATFSRRASDEERRLGLETLAALAAAWQAHFAAQAAAGSPAPGPNAAHRALAGYCHTIMNSAEFLYVD